MGLVGGRALYVGGAQVPEAYFPLVPVGEPRNYNCLYSFCLGLVRPRCE